MSSLRNDVRHGLGIARIELRRSLRKSFGTRKRQLTVLGVVALFTPLLIFWYRIAYSAGQQAAAQGTLPLDVLGIQVSLLVVVFIVMGALRVVQQGRPEGDALLLTATSPRAVLIGVTVHSTIQLVGFVMFPTLLFAGGFAFGSGMFSILPTAVLAVVPLFTAITVLGTIVGQLVVLGLLRSQTLRTVSQAFGLVLLLVLMALSYAAMAPVTGAAEPLAALSGLALPAIEYLTLAFFGTPLGPELDAGAIVVGAIVVASIPVLFAVANQLAPLLWFADATPTGLMQRDATTATGATPSLETTEQTGRSFPPRTQSRTLSVALGLWIRWMRIPTRFSPLFPLVIVIVTALFGAVSDPESLPVVVGGVLVFAGVYISGAIFGLNPMGEAGEMRTLEYLSATRLRTLLLGHLTAGLLAGIPIAVVGATVFAMSLGVSIPTAAILVTLAIVLAVASAGVGVGIGSVLPSRDSQRTYQGYEVATPSQWALVGYMFAVMLLVVIGAGGGVFALLPGSGSESLLRLLAPGVAGGVLAAVGYAGYRTAAGPFSEPPYPRTSSESQDAEV
ncbi:hypothetical protein SAMN05421858_4247 [Haladaptatus litoreus]|uniref:ABC-2 type transport system permease protein n=1 Tax=Haladaptatus litoreus TaxID=553468 RepID=A0A1N7EHF8_9EURY|nr:hypothetical protein [Haladaptatus litoreus]SIR87484.1 hypothetical protein SAMN05421858_4247 [Haladaptatus litoreus]